MSPHFDLQTAATAAISVTGVACSALSGWSPTPIIGAGLAAAGALPLLRARSSNDTEAVDEDDTVSIGVECQVCDNNVHPNSVYVSDRGAVCRTCHDYHRQVGRWPDEEHAYAGEPGEIEPGLLQHDCREVDDVVVISTEAHCPECGSVEPKRAEDNPIDPSLVDVNGGVQA